MAGNTSAAMHHVVQIDTEDTLFATFTSRKYVMHDKDGNKMEVIAYVYNDDMPLKVVELPVRDIRGAA